MSGILDDLMRKCSVHYCIRFVGLPLIVALEVIKNGKLHLACTWCIAGDTVVETIEDATLKKMISAGRSGGVEYAISKVKEIIMNLLSDPNFDKCIEVSANEEEVAERIEKEVNTLLEEMEATKVEPAFKLLFS
ncbi:MAG: hypothetical protein QXH81_07355 [Thermofilaceae archaeon]